jgi:hypothetical protein
MGGLIAKKRSLPNNLSTFVPTIKDLQLLKRVKLQGSLSEKEGAQTDVTELVL